MAGTVSEAWGSSPGAPARGLSRRGVLAGGAAYAGLNLLGLTGARAAAEQSRQLTSERLPRLHSCIFVFLYGGPSHLDTFDLKPDAPSEVRGEFGSRATSVPGLRIGEHLPCLAPWMDRVAVVRSMHHANRLHDSACIETFTGRQGPDGDREEFSPIPQFFPCHGSVLNFLRQSLAGEVPHAVLPWLIHNVIDVPCQGGGLLGGAFDPLRIDGDARRRAYQASMLRRPEGLSLQRMQGRRELLQRWEGAGSELRPRELDQLRRFYGRALELLQSERLRVALDIEREPDAVRARYGLGQASSAGGDKDQAAIQELRGQNLLLARRLVEAGVPFVNVNDFRQQGQNWDSHADNFGQHKRRLLPPIDRGLAALLEDLEQRGLLDTTLVVVSGEFGRTPRINGNAGRDHWPDCYSLLLAGGGVQGGMVLGASDRLGAYPLEDPVTPADLAATIYWRFGIPPTTEIHDPFGRPYRLSDGRPLERLFA